MTVKVKKEEALKVLRDQRRVAAAIDRKAAADYKAARAAAIKERREQLRAWAKLTDEQLAALDIGGYHRAEKLAEVPACPLSVLTQVDRAMSRLAYDARLTLTLDNDDPLVRLMTMTDGPKRNTVCEALGGGDQ